MFASELCESKPYFLVNHHFFPRVMSTLMTMTGWATAVWAYKHWKCCGDKVISYKMSTGKLSAVLQD